jgi:hypothetical protein
VDTAIFSGTPSGEATPSSGKETPSDMAIYRTKEGAKGGKKRRKQRPQGATTMTDHNDGDDGKAGGSDRGRVVTAVHSDKHQVRPSTDHFKRLLEDAYPIYTYPVRNKLKYCVMVKSFMILGSHTRGTEVDKDPGGSDRMPFPGEDIVMMVYGGHPPPRRRHVSTLSPRGPTHYGYIYIYILAAPRDKRKKEQKMAGQIPQGHEHSGWPKLSPMDWRRRPVHLACTPEGDQPLLKPPKVTSGAGKYSVQVTSLG